MQNYHFQDAWGKMVNLFDLNASVDANKLLTDKPHASLSRSQSDVVTMGSLLFEDQIHDKMVVSKLRRTASNRVNGTPIKKLIAHEMLNDKEYKRSPTNVVAKLMGLETLPQGQLDAPDTRSTMQYSRHISKRVGVATECSDQDRGFADGMMHSGVLRYEDGDKYKDVYEIPQPPRKKNHSTEKSPRKGNYDEDPSDRRKMAVMRKFIEAKRMVTDEKLRHSKKFQDATEVLSSNNDLFLRFLHESNSFSQQIYESQSFTPPAETKRITILRPSRMVDKETFAEQGRTKGKQNKKTAPIVPRNGSEGINPGYSHPMIHPKVNEYSRQPTRIVVLKPSPGNGHDIKATVSSYPSSPEVVHGDEYYCKVPEDREVGGSRAGAKLVTQKMRKNLLGVQADDSIIPSFCSNSCDGDDVSSNQSESYYAAEDISEMEITSPPSRHSWDYVTRFDSPYSCSSFSRALNSPESSICREAKKRLSERWALMASNENFHEQRHTSKSASTLGEMLALSDIKDSVGSKEGSNYKEQEPRASTSCLTSNVNKGALVSPKILQRSKSVPVSSTLYATGLNVDISESDASKSEDPKLKKSKSTKLSLKGKVSSFFFSRSKKSTKHSSGTSQSVNGSQPAIPETPISCANLSAKASETSSVYFDDGHSEGYSSDLAGQTRTTNSPEVGHSIEKPTSLKNVHENLEQPSPCSVLEPPFVEDNSRVSGSPSLVKPPELDVRLKSNLIDKSPPIGTIARTLPLDAWCTDRATRYPVKPHLGTREEDDWHSLIHTLLSASGLDAELKPEVVSTKWHSHESPLDPSLRDNYANMDNKEQIHEAKRRQQRSKRKLVFDLINIALLELADHGVSGGSTGTLWTGGRNKMLVHHASLQDYVWAWTKKWFLSGEESDTNSIVVETVVREAVAGNGWTKDLRAELDFLRKELEVKLVEEIVEECVINLARAC